MGCSASPDYNYKNGAFASIVTSDVPVLSCLCKMKLSPLTTTSEKAVFTDHLNVIAKLLGQEAKNGPLSIEKVMMSIRAPDELINASKNDQRAQGLTPSPDMVIHIPPENYNSDVEDVPSLLLHTTKNALELACSTPVGYNNGTFQHIISSNAHVLDTLRLLSQDSRIAIGEKSVFKRAIVEAQKLHDLELTQQRTAQIRGKMYLAHMAWFEPLLEVFNRDFILSGYEKPKWQRYSIMVDDKMVGYLPPPGGPTKRKKLDEKLGTATEGKGRRKPTDFGNDFKKGLIGAFQ
ncbi:hypothetical protein MMC34_001764 [Xylographa carneopallida]|nr:hypothetical protein [Xylographa carneopallida]